MSILILKPKKPKRRLSTLTLSEIGLSRDWDFRMTCYQYLPCFSVKGSKKIYWMKEVHLVVHT